MDLFLGNTDRNRQNFILNAEGYTAKLYALDFASSKLQGLKGNEFPIASSATIQLGRSLRQTHGFVPASAHEALDKIEKLPAQKVSEYLDSMPEGWMSAEQRDGFGELWSKGRIAERLNALRSGLADGSLL